MRVVNHRLNDDTDNPVRFEETPNKSGTISPRFLIIHYTAGRSLESSVSWFKNPEATASAHLVIGRDGEIVQMVPFNKKAWHAGKSRWGDVIGLNNHSIGIELDNAGELTRKASGGWKAWFGGHYDEDEVVVARHKNDPPTAEPSGWHDYPEAQLQALMDVAAALQAKYKFEAVLGHDDIAPLRKRDPGPAFPMTALKSRVEGRKADDDLDPADLVCKICGQPLPLDG
jgi:N-acetylmuramoyl-L-alanine amidase